jgi:hypothetical protein
MASPQNPIPHKGLGFFLSAPKRTAGMAVANDSKDAQPAQPLGFVQASATEISATGLMTFA